MKIKLEINKIKEVGVTLEGVSLSFECSASEVVKVLAGVKTLIEEPTKEVVVKLPEVKLPARKYFDADKLKVRLDNSYTIADIKKAMPELFEANVVENIIANAKSIDEQWHAITLESYVINHMERVSDESTLSSFIIEYLLEAYEFFFEK